MDPALALFQQFRSAIATPTPSSLAAISAADAGLLIPVLLQRQQWYYLNQDLYLEMS